MAKGGAREVCIIEGCDEWVDSNGRCGAHRSFFERNGRDGGRGQCVHVNDNGERCLKKTTTFVGEESMSRCSSHDVTYCRYWQCPNKTPVRSHQWCSGHHQQVSQGAELRRLNLAFGRRKPTGTANIHWFAQYLEIAQEYPLCWTYRSKDRYPNFYIDGHLHKAHRWSYEYFFRVELQSGQEVDHLCKNIRCVNPSHLAGRNNRAEHHYIEKQRTQAIKEHVERTGQKVSWGADPEARLRGWSAFEFALEYQLPFKADYISREVPPKEAPIVINERQALAEALAERTAWLKAQGDTEESYSMAGSR